MLKRDNPGLVHLSEKGLLIAGQKRAVTVDGRNQAFPIGFGQGRQIALKGLGGFEQQLHAQSIVSQGSREIKPYDTPKPV